MLCAFANSGSTVVKHLSYHPKVKGSGPAPAGASKYKKFQNFFARNLDKVDQAVAMS